MAAPFRYVVRAMDLTPAQERRAIEARARELEKIRRSAEKEAKGLGPEPDGGDSPVGDVVTGSDPDAPTKICPQCAEEVKSAALICRFCRYEFAASPPFAIPVQPLAAPYLPPAVESAQPPPGKGMASRVAGVFGTVILLGVGIVVASGFFTTSGPKSPSGGATGGTQRPSETGGTWPSGFQDGMCYGVVFELQQAMTHVTAISDAAKNYDAATMTAEAAAAEDRLQAAERQLDALPDWPPASVLIADLKTGLTSLRQSANLVQTALQANDAEAVAQAGSLMDSGSSALSSATLDIASLRSQYGFSCP